MPEITSPSAQAAYQKFLPTAQALDPTDVGTYRVDPDLAQVNIRTAMQVVAEHRDVIPKHLPKVDLPALEALPELALALQFASIEADKISPSERVVSQKVVEARKLRSALLPVVRAFAANGLVPEAEYESIARGRGPRDTAEDCVALAHVFEKYKAQIKGKHPVAPETIERAEAVGSFLLQHLRPANAPAEKAPAPLPAVDVRNRLAALLIQRYGQLQVVAHYFHGEEHARLAPSLMSRRATRGSKEAEPSVEGSASDANA